MLRLTSLSFAYPAVASNRRVPLYIAPDALRDAHQRLRSQGYQGFVLSTCMRVEIAWVGDAGAAPDILACLYGDGSLTNIAMVRSDDRAFVHLSRVAAGLESAVIGEAEVLSQFRNAVALARTEHPSSGDLGRVLEAAIGIGRSVRRLVGATPRGSLGRLAAEVVTGRGPVAILGAGAMARAVAQHLQGVEFGVFARRSVEVGGKATLAWDLAPEAISRFPTVVSTVPGGVSLVPVDAVVRAMAARSEPLLFIDLGMPPGFKRPHADTPVRYLGVDEVASSADDKPSIEVDEKVTRGASALWHRLSAPSRVGAIIAGLIDQADATVSQEVARFSARLQTADDPERILQQLAHTVARRVLHGPISYVSSTERGLDVAEALAEAFGIPDD